MLGTAGVASADEYEGYDENGNAVYAVADEDGNVAVAVADENGNYAVYAEDGDGVIANGTCPTNVKAFGSIELTASSGSGDVQPWNNTLQSLSDGSYGTCFDSFRVDGTHRTRYSCNFLKVL